MKRTTICVMLFSTIAFLSCKQEAEKTTETVETNTIQKETVIETDTLVIKDTVKPEGTSVKVNSDGIDIDSKDMKVEVKK